MEETKGIKNEEKNEEKKTPIVYTEDPFSYNFVALKKSQVNELPLPTASQMIVNPLYNTIGKSLGIDTVHDWNKYYDKVFTITEWAKERSELEKPEEIIAWIKEASKKAFSLGAKRIDSLYMRIKMMEKE